MGKTFKDLSQEETRNLIEYEKNIIDTYKKQNKIDNILLFGVGRFGNRVLSKIKKNPNVNKLFSDINNDYLNNFNGNKLLLSDDCNNMDYENIIRNESTIADKIKSYDYIFICTNSDDMINCCLTEAISDICKSINKRFSIIHSRLCLLPDYPKAEEQSKKISSEFKIKMQSKKYILNEIPCIDTNFISDEIIFDYCEMHLKTNLYTKNNNFDAVFANIVESNINSMLENRNE